MNPLEGNGHRTKRRKNYMILFTFFSGVWRDKKKHKHSVRVVPSLFEVNRSKHDYNKL